MSERDPSLSRSEQKKQFQVWRLGDIADRVAARVLSQLFDPAEVQKILDLRLEMAESREVYVKRFLDIIAAALDTDDREKVIAGLVGIGMGVTSLVTDKSGKPVGVDFIADSTHFDAASSGRYLVHLGSGTGGQRLLLKSSSENHGFERLLRFPSQGEVISGDYQRAFQKLFGARAKNINPPEYDPFLVASIIDSNMVDSCPCGNGKKFGECHGA